MYSPAWHLGSVICKHRPIHLTFFITRKCNARCPFCFYTHPSMANKHCDELTIDEIRRTSASLGRLLWLAFSGGEIYLRKELVEISNIFYRQNKPSIILLPSNGMCPELIKEKTEQILKTCRRSVIVVKLSLDGLHQDHDALRDTPGNFEQVMHSYRLLGQLSQRYDNFELGINTLFCSQNQHKMQQIIDYVKRLKAIKTHTISMVRGNLMESKYKQIDPYKYRQAVMLLDENVKNKSGRIYGFNGARVKAAQDRIQHRLIYQTLRERRRLLPCYAGKLNLVLTETGDVFPCEILSTPFGNIRDHDYNLNKVVQTEQAKAVLTSIDNYRCHCTHECNFITNILFNPRQYPTLYREYRDLRHAHSANDPAMVPQ